MSNWLDRVFTAPQHVLPQHGLTALVHWLMRVETPLVKNTLIRTIAASAGVDWSEASRPEPGDYKTFNDFFTRTLVDGARPLDDAEGSVICPSDGRISAAGPINGDTIFQAKGHDFSLARLLANDPATSALEGGEFWTIYLSPRDYHRVHMPLAGELKRMTYVPGRLFSVSPATVRQVPGLFARNERVVSIFDTDLGPMAVVLVGAMLVGSMDTAWAGTITPAKPRDLARHDYAPGEVTLARGEEMGRFNMGSTVIVVLPPGQVTPVASPGTGDPVKMGQRLALPMASPS